MSIARMAMMVLAPKAKAFENATLDPMAAQKAILLEYLSRNKDTEYGRKYHFSEIRTIEQYRSTVPLVEYENIRPYINKMTAGETNILVKDKVLFFGATSGTTAEPKYIPSTGYSEVKKALLTDIWSYYIVRDHPGILKGKILAIVSPQVEGHTECGIPYGAESGYGYNELPFFVKNLYVLPHDVFEIKDYAARYYTILRIAIEHNITTVATLNPNTIVLLCQKIKGLQDLIIQDIEKGTLNKKLTIESPIRKKLESRLKANKKRADELKRIVRDHGELSPGKLWPEMEIVECWKGGAMKMYLKELESYFKGVPIRDMGCLSTEARNSIPMSDSGAGGALAITTNFYEFIPKEDAEKSDKRALTCDQLEVGGEYFIVVTTAGGLYRYNIDDLIKVNGFLHKTPIIEFVQKGTNAVSLAGEKLYESQVNEAIVRVIGAGSLTVEFFCVAAEIKGFPRYSFLIEFSQAAVSRQDKLKFLKSFETELRKQNREYDFTRESQILGNPVLKVIKSGEFERYRAKRVAAGAHDGQFKAPELVGDGSFQDNFAVEEEIKLE